MKSCGALILSVTVSILCSSYGSPVSGGAEFDILAEVHHRVARVASLPTAGPNGTTSNPATGSTGSPVTSTSSTSSPIVSCLLLVGIANGITMQNVFS